MHTLKIAKVSRSVCRCCYFPNCAVMSRTEILLALYSSEASSYWEDAIAFGRKDTGRGDASRSFRRPTVSNKNKTHRRVVDFSVNLFAQFPQQLVMFFPSALPSEKVRWDSTGNMGRGSPTTLGGRVVSASASESVVLRFEYRRRHLVDA